MKEFEKVRSLAEMSDQLRDVIVGLFMRSLPNILMLRTSESILIRGYI